MRQLFYLVLLVGALLHFFPGLRGSTPPGTSGARTAAVLEATPSANGFIAVPESDQLPENSITIYAALNCPRDGARRADRLAAQLAERGISARRIDRVSFSLASAGNPDDAKAMAAQVDRVMRGEPPIVFISGRARANPTVTEVMAEYQSGQ